MCIQPTHEDSIDPSASKGGRMKQLMVMLRTLPTNYKLWGSRLSDVTFVISSLGFIQTKIPTNMDTSEIACAGHSLGAFTTAIISGTNVPFAGTNFATTTTDPRVKAGILLSPQGVRQTEQGLGFDSQQSWHDMNIPALFITGTRDNNQVQQLSTKMRRVSICSSRFQISRYSRRGFASHFRRAQRRNG